MNTQKYFNHREILWSMALFLLILTAYQVYLPGTNGIFIFDDMPNLSPMGRYENFSLWDNFWLFLLEGQSGPTGRPISLASFYLNDTHWPSLPSGFIKTNILIHLLNGVLIFWFLLKLSTCLQLNKAKQYTFAFICTTFWLLHPMHTTTVLYIIQRMTELSATFMLTGLIFYLYGREKLFTKPTVGFTTLFIGVGLSLVLSILSKENGILLVAYILVIEFFLLQPLNKKTPKYFSYWLVPAVILPFIAIIIYLGLNTNSNSFLGRNFTLTERLLTEPRILFDYLHHIFIPNMGDITLFHDDYTLSKSIFEPWTTLPSILGIVVLILASYFLRRKAPFIAFAIAWFFAGHIIESTVLPLELYFEHRNYLPIAGIGISIAWYTVLFMRSHNVMSISLVSIFIIFNAFIVFQNATLWGKPLELGISWYKAHPQSERSRQFYFSIIKAYNLMPAQKEQPSITNEYKSLFYITTTMQNLTTTCLINNTTTDLLNDTLLKIKRNTVHVTAGTALLDFYSQWKKGKCNKLSDNDIESFLIKLSSINKIKRIRTFAHNVHYSLADIYRTNKDLDNTLLSIEKAYNYHPNYETLILRAAYLVSAGLYQEALGVLDDTNLLKKTLRDRLTLKIQQKELDRLKQLTQKKIKTTKTIN